MRISFILIIFLILFNAWGALLIDYDIDDHLGINAETGDAPELEQSQQAAGNVSTGEPIGQTLIGLWNNLGTTVTNILVGWQPGVQLLTNIVPAGIASSIVEWAFSMMPIIIAADVLAYWRGVNL